MPEVRFLPDDVSEEVSPSETLLDAARRAGVHISSPCGGEGNCGKCRVVVKQGKVHTPSDHLLTGDERARGLVLACRTLPLSDLVVEVPAESREDDIKALGEEISVMDSPEDPPFREQEEEGKYKRTNPAVRRFLVQVAPPSLESTAADLERVCSKITKETGMDCEVASLAVLGPLPNLLRDHGWKVNVHVHQRDNRMSIVKFAPPANCRNYGIAIDIGTTTVVVQLVDLETGRIMGTRGTLNRQSAYGEDILLRIIHACKSDGNMARLHGLVVDTVNRLTRDLCNAAGCEPGDVHCAVCAGNSTMMHLFLGIPPCSIRYEPFVTATNFPPVTRAADVSLQILKEAPVMTLPGTSGYVGGDITAGVIASGLIGQEESCALIDLGTNGEVVIGNKDWMVSCASSAGPAFEGGGVRCGMRAASGAIQMLRLEPPGGEIHVDTIGNEPARGICGSGLIDALAELLRAGVMDRSGRFSDRPPSSILRTRDGVREIVLVPAGSAGVDYDIVLSEPDIQHVMRSKGAIFTALRVLIGKVGVRFEDISRFYIAGGFGNYLNLRNAVTIGLLPELPEDRFRFVGNASLAGARMVLIENGWTEKLHAVMRRMTYIELSVEPDFMNQYVASLFFPHTDGALFPNIVRELEGESKDEIGDVVTCDNKGSCR